jgi:hypothetical protein
MRTILPLDGLFIALASVLATDGWGRTMSGGRSGGAVTI